MTLAEVEAARVHLVLAKESLFQNSDDQTKASVILKLKNGRSLTPSAAQGIVNMVASSVKGLTPEKVVLIDYRGKILSHNERSDSGLSAQQLDARQKLETEFSNKIVQILEPAVGQGKVRPQVSVLMNFLQVEETVEQYDPQGSVIRSQKNWKSISPGASHGSRWHSRPARQSGGESCKSRGDHREALRDPPETQSYRDRRRRQSPEAQRNDKLRSQKAVRHTSILSGRWITYPLRCSSTTTPG